MGNAVGDKIEGFTAPVGNTLNKGLGVVAKPVGSVLDPLVGGVRTFPSFPLCNLVLFDSEKRRWDEGR